LGKIQKVQIRRITLNLQFAFYKDMIYIGYTNIVFSPVFFTQNVKNKK